MTPIVLEGDHIYRVTFRVVHRARALPKAEPRWFSDLNGEAIRTSQEGPGAEIPGLLSPENLDRILASAQKRVGKGHVIGVYIEGDHGRSLASWNAYRRTWQVTPLTVRS